MPGGLPGGLLQERRHPLPVHGRQLGQRPPPVREPRGDEESEAGLAGSDRPQLPGLVRLVLVQQSPAQQGTAQPPVMSPPRLAQVNS